MRMSKYGAIKTILDGHKFDSRKEANYYSQLKIRKRIGEISDFTLQPKYIIIDSYKCPLTGRKIPATTYSADFLVTYPDGREEVIDIKSEATAKKESYRIKKKAFEQRYGIGIREVVS
jgi:hypothetical protein